MADRNQPGELLAHSVQTMHETLLNSPEFLALVVRSIPDVFFVKDRDYRIVLGNQAFLDLYPPEQQQNVIGHTTVEQYSEKEAAAFLEFDRLAFEHGESNTVETIDMPFGERRTLQTRKIRFQTAEGTEYIAGIARDITDILSDRKALADSEARYSLAVAGSSVGIWDWNRESGDMFWSDRVRQILRIEQQGFVPSLADFIDRVHPDDLAGLTKRARSHDPAHVFYDEEIRLRRDDGTFSWVHLRGQGQRGPNNKIHRVAGSIDDITERKEADRNLRRSHEQLDDFAHIAAHDLRQPLRGIGSLLQFIQEDFDLSTLDPKLAEALTKIARLAERSETMVSNLLEFSRVSSSEDQPEVVNLEAAVWSAVALLPDAEAADIVVQQDMPMVYVDKVSMRVLFRNLIANALNYNESVRKRVEIGVVDTEEHCEHMPPVFFVRDNGIGIHPRSHHKVFKIFGRLHHESAYGGGTGVGMTIVKKIVERHGGEIWLESTLGEGTTFFFTLKETPKAGCCVSMVASADPRPARLAER
ncbi:MAG: ATP-binding protein [Pseudomonadota bacterium]